MSEKRFTTDYSDFIQNDKTFIKRGNERLTYKEIVDLLNEQQATIRRLQDLCGESDGENAKLRIENKRLQEEIKLLKPTNIEQYEQIVQLQEENEQLRAINKKIGDDLYNCRLNKNIISERLKMWQDAHKKYDIYNIKDFEELMKNDK